VYLKSPLGLLVVSLLLAPFIATASPILNGWAINIDGNVVNTQEALGTLPAYASLNTASIDLGNPASNNYVGGAGLGTLTITLTGTPGSHTVGLWLDHAMDENAFIYWQESGAVSGTTTAYQNYQIDEPGYYSGNIDLNFAAGNLPNTNSHPAGSEEDVSMALMYQQFSLSATQRATISFVVSFTQPTSGFYLSQTGPFYAADGVTPTTNNKILYFFSHLDIQETSQVPEPRTFGAGFAALAFGFGGRWLRRTRG
jgi:hypothetical protein